MKVAIYPGSFNPMHSVHLEVISKTHRLFDQIIMTTDKNIQFFRYKNDY